MVLVGGGERGERLARSVWRVMNDELAVDFKLVTSPFGSSPAWGGNIMKIQVLKC